MNDITQFLDAAARGDPKAADELLPLVYDELRKLAAHRMANEAPGHTLQPTALVHEVWLRLVTAEQQTWQNRAHFFGAAAEAMRRILIEHARRKRAARHGGGQQHVNIADVETEAATRNEDQLLSVSEALDKLAERDKAKAELVKLRYFVGMTIEEAAQILGISEPTAKRYWTYARAWLYTEIRQSRCS